MGGHDRALLEACKLFPDGVCIEDPDLQEPFLVEERGLFRSTPFAVLAPRNVDELRVCVRTCAANALKIVPQGGNTGLCGGAVASDPKREVLLSLRKLPKTSEIDVVSQTGTFSASMTLLEAKEIAARHGFELPLSYGSEGTATLGGAVATNAGGMDAMRHGTTRKLVRGLEVVLADGAVLDLMGGLLKDNTGYELRNLFVGSEGTLGIVTKVLMDLTPIVEKRCAALIAVPSFDAALDVLTRARSTLGPALLRIECMSGAAFELVKKHSSETGSMIESVSDWILILEVGTPEADEADKLLGLLEVLFARGLALDGIIAQSDTQAAAIWAVREKIIEAQKQEGTSIKHDISLPLEKLPEFFSSAAALVARIAPGARPMPFGHLGDGNIHYNVQQPDGPWDSVFLEKWSEMTGKIHALVRDLGGSFSAEHGIGRLKTTEMARFKSAEELRVMRLIKTALDPDDLLNPGKVLPPVPLD